jgi:hypothetical protein
MEVFSKVRVAIETGQEGGDAGVVPLRPVHGGWAKA